MTKNNTPRRGTTHPHNQKKPKSTTTPLTPVPSTIQTLIDVQTSISAEYSRSVKTLKAYKGQIERAVIFLKHLIADRRADGDTRADGVDTDLLEKAFENPPNKYSVQALELYITQKCFVDGLGGSTASAIQGAFAAHWNTMDRNGLYAGTYRYDPVTDVVTGNPATTRSFRDLVKSVKNKGQANGAAATRHHAEAMDIEGMRQTNRWSEGQYSSEALRNEPRNDSEKCLAMKHAMLRAFTSSGFTIWTRNFELTKLRARHITKNCVGPAPHFHPHFKVYLENRKGWKTKSGDDGPLESKQYDIYPQDEPAIDMYTHFLQWTDYLERIIGRPLEPDEFIFPYIKFSTGEIHLNREMSYDGIQNLILEFTKGAGLPKKYTTHCFRRGGAQYRFMFASFGQRWSLKVVRWWGGWADNENVDTLMRYLLNSLQSYESGHGDQLCPSGPSEAHTSFMGEHKFVQSQSAAVDAIEKLGSSLIKIFKQQSSTSAPIASSSTLVPSIMNESHGAPTVTPPAIYRPNTPTTIDTLSDDPMRTFDNPTTADLLGSDTSDGLFFDHSCQSDPFTFVSDDSINPHETHAGRYTSPATFEHDPGMPSNHLHPTHGTPASDPSSHWAYAANYVVGAYPSNDSIDYINSSANISTRGTSANAHTFGPPINANISTIPYTSYHSTSTRPVSIAGSGSGRALSGPLRTSKVLNQCRNSPTSSSSPEGLAPIACRRIPDLLRKKGSRAWREALRQWEEADPQTNVALKDWPEKWYKGKGLNHLHQKRHLREVIAMEYYRLGGTHTQFLEAHPAADTETFSALFNRIQLQNGVPQRSSKYGTPEERAMYRN